MQTLWAICNRVDYSTECRHDNVAMHPLRTNMHIHYYCQWHAYATVWTAHMRLFVVKPLPFHFTDDWFEEIVAKAGTECKALFDLGNKIQASPTFGCLKTLSVSGIVIYDPRLGITAADRQLGRIERGQRWRWKIWHSQPCSILFLKISFIQKVSTCLVMVNLLLLTTGHDYQES